MADGASKVVFYEEGKGEIGEYLMYNPPITGDDVSWDEDLFTVVRRNVDVKDNFVRVTLRRKDPA